MIKSMTGHGLVALETDWCKGWCEVKTLNAKYLDINIRVPAGLSSKEIEIRDMISKELERGKVNLTIELTMTTNDDPESVVNEPLFRQYLTAFTNLATDSMVGQDELFRLALTSPEVINPGMEGVISDEKWAFIQSRIEATLSACTTYRSDEGNKLLPKFKDYIKTIHDLLVKVEIREPERLKNLRTRILKNLEELQTETDGARFEQELMHYLDKLDIQEEKVRLKSHLDYFLDALGEPKSNGKKLSFIAQEIGREINTMGAKSNDAEMQRYVVNMKEELEKIKEQVLNII